MATTSYTSTVTGTLSYLSGTMAITSGTPDTLSYTLSNGWSNSVSGFNNPGVSISFTLKITDATSPYNNNSYNFQGALPPGQPGTYKGSVVQSTTLGGDDNWTATATGTEGKPKKTVKKSTTKKSAAKKPAAKKPAAKKPTTKKSTGKKSAAKKPAAKKPAAKKPAAKKPAAKKK